MILKQKTHCIIGVNFNQNKIIMENLEVNLTKEDLISMILGKQPSYDNIEYFSNWGYFLGGFNDRFIWQSEKLERETASMLWLLYNKLKNQYK